ncbi:MAG TPA: DUF6691 family protein [Candidatus Acidoferrales bacterium]|nr:DUF6691 family protein [Candidatus Acidoferrales bacterium]
MERVLAALGAGVLFGLGLCVSGMVNPAKVLAFLDIAGAWDPSLIVVMGGALLVALPAYRLAMGRARPLFAERFAWPTASVIDGRLIAGAALFGIGWGLVGFCPGPAIASFAFGLPKSFLFAAAMAGGAAFARLTLANHRERVAASA